MLVYLLKMGGIAASTNGELETMASFLMSVIIFKIYFRAVFIRCATPGMVSPCCADVGDISAPVAMNKIFFSSLFLTLLSISEQRIEAEQPQPEPPA